VPTKTTNEKKKEKKNIKEKRNGKKRGMTSSKGGRS
jgi:hypothetical protein